MDDQEILCGKLEIPRHLWRDGRDRDQDFSNDELLFRWYPPGVQIEANGQISAAAMSAVFRDTFDVSVAKSRYSEHSTDVLYNPFKIPHRFHSGVLEARVSDIRNLHCVDSLNAAREFDFDLAHKPEVCFYPHSHIEVLENGSKVTQKPKPPTLRTRIREELRRAFKICHLPDPSYRPPGEANNNSS